HRRGGAVEPDVGGAVRRDRPVPGGVDRGHGGAALQYRAVPAGRLDGLAGRVGEGQRPAVDRRVPGVPNGDVGGEAGVTAPVVRHVGHRTVGATRWRGGRTTAASGGHRDRVRRVGGAVRVRRGDPVAVGGVRRHVVVRERRAAGGADLGEAAAGGAEGPVDLVLGGPAGAVPGQGDRVRARVGGQVGRRRGRGRPGAAAAAELVEHGEIGRAHV